MNKAINFARMAVGPACKLCGRIWSSRARMTTAITAVALTAAISVLAAALIFPSATLAKKPSMIQADNPPAIPPHHGDEVTTFTVDVTQDAKTNVQNDVDPSEGQILFTRGDTFIVDGALYPAGTIPSGIADPDPNARVIGKYRIRGTALGNSADFNRAVAGDPGAPRILFFATEVFSIPDDETTILTDGVWPNARMSAHRVVLGGTGRFRGVVGEIYEENIGEGTSGFCNSRVTFRIRKASTCHDH
jgi:hypothetical protein